MSSLDHGAAPPRLQRRFGRVADAVAYASVSSSRLYEWAKKNQKLFRKNGNFTIVDFEILDQILDELPVADLKSAD